MTIFLSSRWVAAGVGLQIYHGLLYLHPSDEPIAEHEENLQ